MTALNRITEQAETTTNTDTYYSQPYDPSGTGFYFHTWAEYCEKVNANRCEEFEIQYIDGDEAELFKACGVDQSNIDQWFELLDELEDYDKPALFYACDVIGLSMAEAMEQQGGGYRTFEDYSVTPGTAKEWAEQYIDDSGMLENVPENVRWYFDYDAFARDLVLNGDLYEFTYDGDSYTASR